MSGRLSVPPSLKKPGKEAFTKREWDIVRRHSTPAKVQQFLRRLRYNKEAPGRRILSFREVVRRGDVHCFEAALIAAVILEQHEYPPLVVSLESQDGLDHVIFVFRHRGRWGAVGRSRDAGLHGRRPVFRSIRDLMWSYYDPYVDFTGKIVGYQLADLRDLGEYDWRLSRKNMWKAEQFLLDLPHRKVRSSIKRYRRLHRAYKAFRRRDPDGPADYYPGRKWWM
jgi:hypothetical protein